MTVSKAVSCESLVDQPRRIVKEAPSTISHDYYYYDPSQVFQSVQHSVDLTKLMICCIYSFMQQLSPPK